jgi:hypothetical protein
MRKPLLRAALLGTGALAIFAALPASEMAVAHAGEYSSTSPFPSSPCDYVNVDGRCEQGPNQNPGNFKCCDGTNSHATHRNGACSHHGGICG